jgi:hypothetical protein
VKVVNGDPRHSDHRPLIITTENQFRGCGRKGPGCFRFEASWLEEEQCAEVVKEAWRKAMEGAEQTSYDAIKVVAAGL